MFYFVLLQGYVILFYFTCEASFTPFHMKRANKHHILLAFFGRVTNCPGMPGTVPESRVCVPRPGQKQSGTIKCPGIGSTALIMVKEPLYLDRVGMKLTFGLT